MMAECFDELDDLSQFTVVFVRGCPSLRNIDAHGIADGISNQVRDTWGGQEVYFKSSSQLPLLDDTKQNSGDRFLVDLQDSVKATLRAHNITARDAMSLASQYTHEFHSLVYGQQIYIRKICPTYYQSRDDEIYRRFDGRNALELCREFGFSMQRFRQVIRQVSLRRRKAV